MKQIQGSIRVKLMNTFMHGPSFFSFSFTSYHFHFLSPHEAFYYFTSLHGLQDVENHCAHLRDIELKTGRKIPYLRFPRVKFSM